MTVVCYEVNPVDFGWNHLETVSDAVHRLCALSLKWDGTADKSEDCKESCSDLSVLTDGFEKAVNIALSCQWEGDLQVDPAVFWIPVDINFVPCFVFKQMNSGMTFVVTPVELPHLEQPMMRKKVWAKDAP